jgi:hypothetical protein
MFNINYSHSIETLKKKNGVLQEKKIKVFSRKSFYGNSFSYYVTVEITGVFTGVYTDSEFLERLKNHEDFYRKLAYTLSEIQEKHKFNYKTVFEIEFYFACDFNFCGIKNVTKQKKGA